MCEVSVMGVCVICHCPVLHVPIHRRAATHGKRLFPPRLWTCLQVGGLASTGY